MVPFYDRDVLNTFEMNDLKLRREKQGVIIGVLTLLALVGCQRPPSQVPELEALKLPTRVAGTSDAQLGFLQKRLHQRDIRIVNMGDEYLISIPASTIFADQSPKIRWESYAVLNEVACYLRQYRKVAIQVSVYVSPYGSERRQMALSTARAETVSNYLWSQGVDGRLIVAHGQGSQKPVVVKNPPNDRDQNARIEITFRRVEA